MGQEKKIMGEKREKGEEREKSTRGLCALQKGNTGGPRGRVGVKCTNPRKKKKAMVA